MLLRSKFSALRALAVLAAFFGLVVASDAAFATVPDIGTAQIEAAKDMLAGLIKALAGIAIALLVGRTVLRALRMRI